MSRRSVAAILWFVATWFGWEVAWSLAGVPRVIGPVAGFVLAAAVTMDPLGVIWTRSAGAPTRTPARTVEAQIPAR